jgi:tRNA(fMet)-specific endonuclease VapC
MSLFVLDTDILTLLQHHHPAVLGHVAAHSPADVATTVISVEEQLSGWFTQLRRAKRRDALARAYQELAATTMFLSGLMVLSFTEPAMDRYDQLRQLKLNVGRPDLRIAAITLENAAVVVTRNTRDFQQIPGLTLEDWTV